MNNIILSILYLFISFTLTLVFFKKWGKYGLFIWMCLSVIICNIQSIKLSDIFGISISLGNISYGAIFLSTDILSEKYNKEITKKATLLSFVVMLSFTILMLLFLQYDPSVTDFSQNSLNTIFSFIPRITIGSLVAFYASQMIDTIIYSYLKEKYHKVWISNNVSTFLGQIVDTLLFVIISYLGVFPFKEIVELFVSMLIFKWIIALLDTPFIMFATKLKQKELE